MSHNQNFETLQRHEFAVRRFKQIVPQALPKGSGFPIRDVQVWLKDDVCPVIEDFAKRPRFREMANWPLRAFADGAKTPERLVVRAIDAALVAVAQTLSELCAEPAIHRALAKNYPPQRMVVGETIGFGGDSRGRFNIRQVKKPKRRQVDLLAAEIAQVAAMGKRPWHELTRVEDYFEPVQEWTREDNHKPVQRGEFIVSLNPELHALGNFVVRCMSRRIEGFYEILAAVRKKYLTTFAGKKRQQESLRRLQEQWQQLEEQIAKLREYCQTGQDNVLRDSCIILTQVYAAFHPKPDVSWLGLPGALVRDAAGVIRARLNHFQNAEMIERIAIALGDLSKLYEDEAPDLSAREEAIASGGLVIDVDRAEAFWEGRPINGTWKGSQWKLLVALAEKARLKAHVEERNLSLKNAKADSFMATTCGRLKNQLPPTLRKLIVTGSARRSYRLDLEPFRIHILRKAP